MAYLNEAAGTAREGTAVPRLGVITQTILKSAFTDGGALSGTRTMTTQLPIGAIFIYSKVKVNVAFTGDTTAVLVIGDGSDVDRYNTATPSIFALAVNGIEMGKPSGNQYHAVATTVTFTVTSTADFTNVNTAGSLTVSLYYLATV